MQYLPIQLPEDLAAVIRVSEAAFAASADASLEAWFSFEEMEENMRRERGFGIKAVDENKQILGLVYAQPESPINSREGFEKWVINLTAVLPDRAGEGIGSGLLKALESAARLRGVLKIFVFTNENDERVQHFYQKNGYEAAGRVRDYQYGDNNSAIFLLKYL